MENSYGFGAMSRFGDECDLELDPYDVMDIKKVLKDSNGDKKDKKAPAVEKEVTKGPVVADDKKSAAKGSSGKQSDSRNHVKFADQTERNNLRNKGDSGAQGQRRSDDRPPRRLDARKYEGGQRPPRRDGENRPPRRAEGEGRPPFRQDGDRPRFSEGGRGGGRRFDGEDRSPREDRQYTNGSENGAPRRFAEGGRDGEMSRGGGRGRGGMGGRGGRGGGRGGPGGRRDFDRRSGSERTGVKAVDKRGGGGAHNWGSEQDRPEEADAADQARGSDGEATEEKPAGDVQVNGAGDSGDEATPKEPEEPKEMTLDEYRKNLQKSRVRPEFNERKAGEGVDSSEWESKYTLLHSGKNAILEQPSRDKKSARAAKEVDPATTAEERKVKNKVDTNFFFNDSVGRGGRGRGRGGRGSGRGRGGSFGGRGYNRDGPSKPSAPRMDSEGDFPSLK